MKFYFSNDLKNAWFLSISNLGEKSIVREYLETELTHKAKQLNINASIEIYYAFCHIYINGIKFYVRKCFLFSDGDLTRNSFNDVISEYENLLTDAILGKLEKTK